LKSTERGGETVRQNSDTKGEERGGVNNSHPLDVRYKGLVGGVVYYICLPDQQWGIKGFSFFSTDVRKMGEKR